MTMHFLYTINHTYLFPACVSILSIIENHKEENLHFHIITSAFTLEDYLKLDKFPESNNRVSMTYYRLEDYPIEKYEIPSWRGTQIANARLFFQDIIKLDAIDKLVYLDADTIVLNNLKELFSYESAINAVLENPLKSKLERMGIRKYFNSGVLLFDVKKWVKEDYQREIIDFKRKSKNLSLTWPDQDLLNLAIGERIEELPFIYNVFPYALISKFHFNELFYNDVRRANRTENINEKIANASIFHSAGLGNIKPWNKNKVNPLNEEFQKMARILDSTFKPEKLKGIETILANQPNLYYFFLYAKNICFPEQANTIYNAIKSLKRK